jgi:hypothetical protein
MSAVGAITAVASLANTYNSYKTAKTASKNVLSHDDALARAQASLNSLYNKKVTNTISDLNNASAARGFYGQAAADQIKNNTIGDIRTQQAAHAAGLASQLQNSGILNALDAQKNFTDNLNSTNFSGLNGIWNYLAKLGEDDNKYSDYVNSPDAYKDYYQDRIG